MTRPTLFISACILLLVQQEIKADQLDTNTIDSPNMEPAHLVTSQDFQCGLVPMWDGADSDLEGRVVGGRKAKFGQYPYLVKMFARSEVAKNPHPYCGAVLISPMWVLTAAHCLTEKKVDDLVLGFGDYDVEDKEYELFDSIDVEVAEIHRHPMYNETSADSDIALMKLKEPIEFDQHIQPICLPDERYTDYQGNATVAGWGQLISGPGSPLSPVIQHASLPIISNKDCREMYKNSVPEELGIRITENMICAGSAQSGLRACQGDSGGPLAAIDDDGRSVLIGLTSWGGELGFCDKPNRPSVFARVTKLMDWVKEITKDYD